MKTTSLTSKSAKVAVAISLAVITVGVSLPENSLSRSGGGGGGQTSCKTGDVGDCETEASTGNKFCAIGVIFDDCE